jgi:hypothetical protein
VTQIDNQAKKQLMALRRPAIFTAAMAIASFIVSLFWVAPFVVRTEEVASIFSTALEEDFFYDIFAWSAAAWLVAYVFNACAFNALGRFGQWAGIFLLSVNQVVLSQQCAQLAHFKASANVFAVPLLIETWLICLYFGFFCLPSLMKSGNNRLVGIATLAITLPWLIGKSSIVLGSQVLTGLF